MPDTATISEYPVAGMSCQHCVAAVTEEVGAIPGVIAVRVDLAAGRVRITSEGPLDDAAVHAAVEDAGYEVVG
ncbi:MAG TPA: cation transporter [Pseudonocardiaceae bacterium]|jgi:copper ion binding protein|nr:cation transporter [Pseudonocardiaceae bacterium]